jgi:hypothetical protein
MELLVVQPNILSFRSFKVEENLEEIPRIWLATMKGEKTNLAVVTNQLIFYFQLSRR